jgi:23S rRNA (adenine2503-C2)-methyltransferase
MLKDVNDLLSHADELYDLLKDRPAKVNLIPFNPFAGNTFVCSERVRITQFQNRLRERGLVTTTRKTRGADIDAACGQLAGKVSDKLRVRLSQKTINMATA